jgi:unsaturated rhamnogalacturonyl hydrolase
MKCVATALSVALLLIVSGCQGSPVVLSPTEDGIAIGDSVKFIFKGKMGPDTYRIYLDDTEINPEWQPEAYPNRWISTLELPTRGPHVLRLESGLESPETVKTVSFRNDLTGSVAAAELNLSHVLNLSEPEDLAWNWTSAIFLYPLARIAEHSDQGDQYLDYVRRFHLHYMDVGTPPIDLADACPSALSAYYLFTRYGEDFAMPNVDKVINYIKTVELNSIGSIDHLGDSWESLFYPSSIWVDSLMMWVLIAVQVGMETSDQDLLDRALVQPGIFAERLHDPDSGLFFHAWNVEEDQLLPLDNTPWLRGNGWALAAILEMMSAIGSGHPRYSEFASIFVGLAQAILPHRQPSGYWDTVILQPGFAYEESSGSALVAYAFAKGARLGLLDAEYRDYAKETFAGIVARMKKHEDGYSMEEISVGTNPFNAQLYKLMPKVPDQLYGNGALLLLAEELAGESF